MTFFTDPSGYTHRARLYGVPCYFRSDGFDGCRLAGTNAFYELLLNHWVPLAYQLAQVASAIGLGVDYEPQGWPIELLEEMHTRA